MNIVGNTGLMKIAVFVATCFVPNIGSSHEWKRSHVASNRRVELVLTRGYKKHADMGINELRGSRFQLGIYKRAGLRKSVLL